MGENERLALLYRQGDKSAGERLLELNNKLAHHWAQKYAQFAAYDDLLQQAREGLIFYTLHRWQPGRATWITGAWHWSRTYAGRYSRQHGNRQITLPEHWHFKNHYRHKNLAGAPKVVLSLDDTPSSSGKANYGELLPSRSRPVDELAILRVMVQRLLAELSDKLRHIVISIYWGEKTTDEIGRELGITGQCVRQYHKQAIDLLRLFVIRDAAEYATC